MYVQGRECAVYFLDRVCFKDSVCYEMMNLDSCLEAGTMASSGFPRCECGKITDKEQQLG